MSDTEIRTVGYEVVPLDRLRPNPDNVNEGNVDAILDSMDALGFYGAILAREDGTIIAGEHRWRAARQRGMAEVPVLWTAASEDEARRIMLGDNRIARLGRDDERALTALLADLAADDGSLAGTGYDRDDLDVLLQQVEAQTFLDDEPSATHGTTSVVSLADGRSELHFLVSHEERREILAVLRSRVDAGTSETLSAALVAVIRACG